MRLRRPYAGVILVVALVLLAGCTGGGGGDATTTTTAPTETSTAPPDTTTTEKTTTTTEPPRTTTTTEPPRTTTTGGGDGGSFLTDYRDQVEQAGSYTVNYHLETSGGTSSGGSFSGTVQVDIENRAQFQRLSIERQGSTITVEQYLPPGGDTVYMCTIFGGQCQQRQEQSIDETSGFYNFTSPFSGGATNLSETPDFTDAGLVETENGTRRKYTVTSLSQIPDQEGTRNLSSIDMAIFVNPETSLITKFTYEATAETDQGTVTTTYVVHYTDYGSTTVEAPEWYQD